MLRRTRGSSLECGSLKAKDLLKLKCTSVDSVEGFRPPPWVSTDVHGAVIICVTKFQPPTVSLECCKLMKSHYDGGLCCDTERVKHSPGGGPPDRCKGTFPEGALWGITGWLADRVETHFVPWVQRKAEKCPEGDNCRQCLYCILGLKTCGARHRTDLSSMTAVAAAFESLLKFLDRVCSLRDVCQTLTEVDWSNVDFSSLPGLVISFGFQLLLIRGFDKVLDRVVGNVVRPLSRRDSAQHFNQWHATLLRLVNRLVYQTYRYQMTQKCVDKLSSVCQTSDKISAMMQNRLLPQGDRRDDDVATLESVIEAEFSVEMTASQDSYPEKEAFREALPTHPSRKSPDQEHFRRF